MAKENVPVSGGYTHDIDTDTFSFGAAAGRGEVAGKLPSFGRSNTNSPADLWFSNGQILPHTFPSRAPNKGLEHSSPRTTCTAYGNNSNGSSSSSRSSSNTSSRSNSSGNRLSNTDPANLRRSNGSTNSHHQNSAKRLSDSVQEIGRSLSVDGYQGRPLSSPVKVSQVKKNDILGTQEAGMKIQSRRRATSKNSSHGRGFFRSLVTACRECHALEPSGPVDRMPGKIGVRA